MPTIVKELPNRSYSINAQIERTFTRSWRVTFDTPDKLAYEAVDEVGIAIGDSYHTSFVNNISSDQDSEDGRDWKVVATYGPYEVRTPLDEPPKIDWSYEQRTEIIERDVFGQAILNSAKDPYQDPVEVDRVRPVLTIVRNEPSFDAALAYEYCNAINATPFFGCGPGCVKLSDTSSSWTALASLPDGGYWTTTYKFQFSLTGFDKIILDRGFRKIVSTTGKKENILIQGVPVTEPVLLNGLGEPLPQDAGPMYGIYFVYPRLPFTIFDF